MPNLPIPPFLLIAISLWSLIWKGFALWRSARLSQQNWFIAILFLNSAGILEIAYLFWFAKEKITFDFSDIMKRLSFKKGK